MGGQSHQAFEACPAPEVREGLCAVGHHFQFADGRCEFLAHVRVNATQFQGYAAHGGFKAESGLGADDHEVERVGQPGVDARQIAFAHALDDHIGRNEAEDTAAHDDDGRRQLRGFQGFA